MKPITLISFLLLLVVGVEAQNSNQMNVQKTQNGRGSANVAYQQKFIDQMIYEFLEEENIPGITLAIVQAPYIPRVVSYGVTNLKYKNLASTKTVYPAGPISQAFTAVAVMQLYEQKKLDIYKPISSYLKHIPQEWKDVTIFELLQHSSGIPDYRNEASFSTTKKYRSKNLIESITNKSLHFASGTQVEQSATNFLLLADVVEKISHMSYADFITNYQIKPLGLQQTYHGDNLDKIKQENLSQSGGKHHLFLVDNDYIAPSELTQGYVENAAGKLEATQPVEPSSLKGFSDIWASAENISHWDIALAGGLLIKDKANRDIIYGGETKLKDGKKAKTMGGWQFYNHKGLLEIKGNVAGHSTFLSRFTAPSELVCVTLMANKEGVDLTNLARRVAGAFDEKLAPNFNDNSLFTYESQFDINTTLRNIQTLLKKNNIPVFAIFDHDKNATEVGLNLRPTKVIVFGSPKVGTLLMQENQGIARELPLKITLLEDDKGRVWVSFSNVKEMAKKYGLENHPIVGKMQILMQNLVKNSSSIF